jgi:transcription initiation factor IIE alpha subunit
MHQVKVVDMLSAKMDMLMKKLDERDQQKREVMHIHDSHMTCEEYGGTSHTGSNCPKVQEDVNYIDNNANYHHQQNQGWNQ